MDDHDGSAPGIAFRQPQSGEWAPITFHKPIYED